MKGKQKDNIKDKNGITLIALIITIIVLLILAGVSIAMLSGENGILKRAVESREKTGRTGLIEQVQVEVLESLSKNQGKTNKQDLYNILTKYFTNVPEVGSEVWNTFPEGFPDESGVLKAKEEYGKYDDIKIGEIYEGTLSNTKVADKFLKPGEKAITTKKYNYEDTNKDKATVPAGFKVSQEPDEQNVKDGLVIIDDEGNEFVWIPCTVEQYEDAKDDVMDEIENGWISDNAYKDNGDNSYTGTDGGGKGREWRDDYTEGDNSKIKETYTTYDITTNWVMNQTERAEKSIGDYGGFYIARYEAGVPSNAPFCISNEDLSYNNVNKVKIKEVKDGKYRGAVTDSVSIKDLKPVSKQGMQAWNYITQPNSKMVAENMYKGNEDVGSYLVDSQAWNHICKNIFKNNKEGKSITNSESWGNYHNNTVKNYTSINGLWANFTGGVPLTYTKGQVTQANSETNYIELGTGASDEFKLYNIYDMAGNMWEWTTGHNIKNNTMFIVPRGGAWNSLGKIDSVAAAHGFDQLTFVYDIVGFRVVLYIN